MTEEAKHRVTPAQALWESRQIAERRRMFVSEKDPKPREKSVRGKIYIVYLRALDSGKPERLHRFGDVYGLLTYMRGIDKKLPAEHATATA